MAIVTAAILLLMTCWSFWGWIVGDSRNIKWIRHWCGGSFVVHVAVLAAASGFFIARSMERSDARKSAADALHVIAERIQARDAQSVLREIRSLDHSEDPDRDAYDLLVELPEFTARLRTESPTLAGDSQATSDAKRR